MLIGFVNNGVYYFRNRNDYEYTGKSTEQVLVDYFNDSIEKIASAKKMTFTEAKVKFSSLVFFPSYHYINELVDFLKKTDLDTDALNIDSSLLQTASEIATWELDSEIGKYAEFGNYHEQYNRCVVDNIGMLVNLSILTKISDSAQMSLFIQEQESDGRLVEEAASYILKMLGPLTSILVYKDHKIFRVYDIDQNQLVLVLLTELFLHYQMRMKIEICAVCGKMFFCSTPKQMTCSTKCCKKHYEWVRTHDIFFRTIRNYKNRIAAAHNTLEKVPLEGENKRLSKALYDAERDWGTGVDKLRKERRERKLSRCGFTLAPQVYTQDAVEKIEDEYGDDVYDLKQLWNTVGLEQICMSVKDWDKTRRKEK